MTEIIRTARTIAFNARLGIFDRTGWARPRPDCGEHVADSGAVVLHWRADPTLRPDSRNFVYLRPDWRATSRSEADRPDLLVVSKSWADQMTHVPGHHIALAYTRKMGFVGVSLTEGLLRPVPGLEVDNEAAWGVIAHADFRGRHAALGTALPSGEEFVPRPTHYIPSVSQLDLSGLLHV